MQEFTKITIEKDYLPYRKIELNWLKKESNPDTEILRSMIIFGRNGTGKSTISKSISSLRDISEDITLINEKNRVSNTINITDSDKETIFVYNEEFQNEKVTFIENERFEAIVLIDDQKDLMSKIALNKSEVKILESKLTQYNDALSTAENDIKESIVGTKKSRWKSIFSELNDKNPYFNASLINRISSSVSSRSVVELGENLSNLIKEIESAKNEKRINRCSEVEIPINEIKDKLKIIAEPVSMIELTERENQIIEILGNNVDSSIEKTENILKGNSNNCPTCFQEINEDYKRDTLAQLKSVLKKQLLNNEISEHIECIDQVIKISELIIAELDFVDLDKRIEEDVRISLNKSIEDLKSKLNLMIKKLKDKKSNVYRASDFSDETLFKAKNAYDVSLSKYNRACDEYNIRFNKLDENIKEANKLNDKLAYKETENFCKELFENREKINKAEKSIEELNEEIVKDEQLVKNTTLALNNINKQLGRVFYESERLKLEQEDGFYYVLSRGKRTKLSSLSTGERNAIGLCYFFSIVNQNQNVDNQYNLPLLIVLDDPVSSFDHEIKLGIYSLLRGEIEKIGIGNENSKILILTHDSDVYYNCFKIFEDILDADGKRVFRDNQIKLKQLNSMTGIETAEKEENFYSTQLTKIYEFACIEDEECDFAKDFSPYIGNVMRRVLEAFSTFNYQKGISELSSNEVLLSESIDDREERELLKSHMYRLLLNGESHYSDKIYGITERDREVLLTIKQKIQTARFVLVLLYSLNPIHLKYQINNLDQTILERWKSDLIGSKK
ncbi:AAA family ATPase [Streptococcus periodonticum]|uniref:AAA family ATPase n=1 Tax=Streptococcus periodonticum TaxID=2490633 RepID=UPI00157F8448|nr:AAA family ATPase [Streptococcus periodonticum]